jgi:hypothetical protein|tara:strand:- start:7202 stop:7495 length:294 start_codon:yes stop_codon:yes gene_type:complete
MLKTIVISFLLSLTSPLVDDSYINHLNENKEITEWGEHFVKETNVIESFETCVRRTILPKWSSWERIIKGKPNRAECTGTTKLMPLRGWHNEVQKAK